MTADTTRRVVIRLMSVVLALVLAAGCESTQTRSPQQSAAEASAEMEQLWAQATRQQIPAGHVWLKVERYSLDLRDTEAFDILAKYRSEHVDVDIGSPAARGGLKVFAAGNGLEAELRVQRTSRFSRASSSQFLLLSPGEPASLSVLRMQTEPWLVVIPFPGGAVVGPGVHHRVTGTSLNVNVFAANPSVVDMELAPLLHSADSGPDVVVEQLRTRIAARPGQRYVIMASRDEQDSVASRIFSRRSESRQTTTIISLIAEVGR